MKRHAGWLLIFVALAALPLTRAQKEAAPGQTEAGNRARVKEAEPPSETETGGQALWRFANFVLLIGALGYIAYKQAGPYFARRTLAIQKGAIEADEIRADADARVAAVEAKLAGLEAEIAALRQDVLEEQRAETERFRAETQAELAKLRARTEQEIASVAKAARLELRRYTVEMALQLAERKIQAGMTGQDQDALVSRFVERLSQPVSQAQTT